MISSRLSFDPQRRISIPDEVEAAVVDDALVVEVAAEEEQIAGVVVVVVVAAVPAGLASSPRL